MSPEHVEWVGIEKAASAAQKRETDYLEKKAGLKPGTQAVSPLKVNGSKTLSDLETVPLRSVIRKRRSAMEMNNSAYMEKETFYEDAAKNPSGK